MSMWFVTVGQEGGISATDERHYHGIFALRRSSISKSLISFSFFKYLTY